MTFAFACFSLAATVAQAWDVPAEWQAFKVRFGRAYNGEEESKRFAVFQDNLDFIVSENNKGHKFTLGITPFADQAPEELELKNPGVPEQRSNTSLAGVKFFDLNPSDQAALQSSFYYGYYYAENDYVDWEARGATTPVVNENMPPNGYGACWAFAAAGALESAEKIFNGRLVKLSEQQFVDCSGQGSCTEGGLPEFVWQWLQRSGSAVCTEASYPYTCFTGSEGCRAYCEIGLPQWPLSGYTVVPRDESLLMSALMQQPVAGAVAGAWKDPTCDPSTSPHPCSSHPQFQFYTGGIYSNPDCKSLDHAVLIVGYGTSDSGEAYWKIKNSYGPNWGIDGYALLERGRAGNSGPADSCGVPGLLSFPNLRQNAKASWDVLYA